jgi:phosphoribosylformimino-5-aminoimidazole carboxamide ribotide isomerase
MILLPAIDIQNGKAVRLRQGDFAQATVFADDPAALALQWRYEGAEALHVVDLDGARQGQMVNFDLVQHIAASLDIPVEYGGGVRDRESLDRAAASSLRWIVLGTSAVIDEELLAYAVEALGDRLVVGVDCTSGYVATHGWQERSKMTARQFIHQMERRGVKRVVYTDVMRDGMLEGPNMPGLIDLAETLPLDIVMSGGITTLDDLRRIRKVDKPNVVGAIVGRALYEGAFTLAQAKAALA